jgi:hypothetical protein
MAADPVINIFCYYGPGHIGNRYDLWPLKYRPMSIQRIDERAVVSGKG